MRTSTFILLCFCLFILSFGSFAQAPFHRGVNMSGWFQSNSIKYLQFSKYTKQDLQNLKTLGCDVFRLPIELHSLTNGSPDYVIDPLLFSFLDQVLDWAEELNLYVLLDNHSFDPAVSTDAGIGAILNKVWLQMAYHFNNRSNFVLYEILNEPHGITTTAWGDIQANVIQTIRSVDSKHTIVVGASGYNSISEMSALPIYTDQNLLYTFHFYDPFLFTHQGASWASPSMVNLSGVPFPYQQAAMPACPADLKGSWIEGSLNNYQNDGTVANIQNLLNGALAFKAARNVNIFCGEYGAYNINSKPADRVAWYAATQSYLSSKNIPWTSWDYQNGFGLFNKGSNELFNYDLNTPLLSAMGLNVPQQQVYVPKPEMAAFPVYQEYIEASCFQASSENGGSIDFYNQDNAKINKYCIKWTGSNQYGSVGFNFKPTKDLSVLVKNDFAVSFWLKCDQAATKFDVRFIDTKTGANDHPWRMNSTVDQTIVPMDGAWHFVYLPLKNFVEGGSFDNNTYIPQAGLFDWSAVDMLEFVNEYSSLANTNIWIDNIVVTNNKLLDVPALSDNETKARIFFDAANQCLNIRCKLKDASYQVLDLVGKVIDTGSLRDESSLIRTAAWNKGVYVVKLKAGEQVFVTKFIVE